jgi:hypothetical protein
VNWRDRAACRGKPLAWFFPPEGHHVERATRLLCAGCPVNRQCLRDAVLNGDDGFRAGFTEEQRRRMVGDLNAWARRAA